MRFKWLQESICKNVISLMTVTNLLLLSHSALSQQTVPDEPNINSTSQNVEPTPENTIAAPPSQHRVIFHSLPSNNDNKENPFDAKNYALAKQSNEYQNSMVIATWVMAALMVLTIILLAWNGYMLRKANRFGRSMAFSGVSAARASARAASANDKALLSSRMSNMLQLRPHLSFNVTHWALKKENERFYISLSLDITNNGATPAKDLTRITITKCAMIPIDGLSSDFTYICTNKNVLTSKSNPNTLYARYIAPNTTITRGASVELDIPTENERMYTTLAEKEATKKSIKYLQIDFSICFKDDYKIQSREHYKLKLSFLSGFSENDYVRIDAEDTLHDENTYLSYEGY